jgi:hypothetical protein
VETLTVKKGKKFEKFYTLTIPGTNTPFPVAGWSLRATARDYPGSVQTLHEWPSGDLLLVDGKATILVPAATSAEWVWTLGYYDIEMYNGPTVIEIDKGRIYADFEVSI